MATLDPRTDAIVIRIVYDGAPMAGKSTSVRALGRGLGGDVLSPAEIGGRTLYFDWLDYTGGLFEGHRIRCQIVSVPGQATLAPRRRRLLQSADAIVFVGDSTPAGFAADHAYLAGLRSVLDNLGQPPVGIVFQANKRDCPEAIPIAAVRSMLEGAGLRLGVVESVATDGTGIREAFVFAVRLALDRVRELMRSGELSNCRPVVDNAQDLLEQLKYNEEGRMEYAAASGLVHTRLADLQAGPGPAAAATAAAETATGPAIGATGVRGAAHTPNTQTALGAGAAPNGATRAASNGANGSASAGSNGASTNGADVLRPAPPDDTVASGMIWPPVDGRIVLHELAQAGVSLTRTDQGGWTGTANNRWQLHSSADAVFADVEKGRSELVQSARAHAGRERQDSLDRCLALASDGHGRHRLWLIERIKTSSH